MEYTKLLTEEEYIGFLKGSILGSLEAATKENNVDEMNKCINYCHQLQRILVKNNQDDQGIRGLILDDNYMQHTTCGR